MTDREEQEPLLGSAEGVAQEDGVPIYNNLILGKFDFVFGFLREISNIEQVQGFLLKLASGL
jgi:hypothetical protein